MQGKVYAQVYSLIKTQREGVLSALGSLSKIGYDGVELLGNMTDGVSRETFKQILKELKLDVISSHGLHNEEDFEFAADVGARYCDLRLRPTTNRDEVLQICEELNQEGALRKKFGLHAVIHNHANELYWIDGKEGEERVYDVLLNNTDPDLVNFEFDVGWGARAGADVVEYIRKYPGRFPLIHVKECAAAGKTVEEMEHFPRKVMEMGKPQIIDGVPFFKPEQYRLLDESRRWNVRLGKGLIDWKALVEACEAQGTVAYINERENFDIEGVINGNVLQCAKADYEFLRSL